jgi:hypothetical protein
MAHVSGQLKSSVNAGQLSESLWGKVNLKQYYSGAKRMVGVEAIPQSGFSLLPGSFYAGTGVAGPCIQSTLVVSPTLSYTLFFMAGSVEIWRQDLVKVATLSLPQITAEILPRLEFYGEANTVGIFHQNLWKGLRLLRNAADDSVWTVSDWPYDLIPDVDLGGTYEKKADIWSLYLRWSDGVGAIIISMTVDGSPTAAVDRSSGAAGLQAAIAALPGFASGVTVVQVSSAATSAEYRVTFGDALAGGEYDFDASVVNTSSASALVSHTQVGETVGEPLISATRGGFAGMVTYQDRSIYYAPAARPAALAMSRIGEYFDLNIKSQNDAAARLEALRTEASETVIAVVDAAYLIAFTDRSEYFASNRTIERNKPLNWVRASQIGTKRGCKPALFGEAVYFVSRDGGRLYSVQYDAVSEVFKPEPVNDLNADLVSNIRHMVVQRKGGSMVADRLWLLREDGRLVSCMANVGQDIPLAAAEWPVAGDGFVHGISADGLDRVWITVERGGVFTREVLFEADESLFQVSMQLTSDLTGRVSGLALFNGRSVWAEINGDVHGPFYVSSGFISVGVPGVPVLVGIWRAPVFESVPFIRVLANDDVVRRPGKVNSLRLFLRDTTSIAVGANGRAPKDLPLQRMSDDLSAPKRPYTGHTETVGLIGACMDPTLTITQVRPGKLNVRDFIAGVKL